ncbi:MAG: PTS system mannose/fructose/sorbose family transporter subunit IID [Candidatus Eisenbacteria bacterium]|uniref:PTS system mannose/fructose/sorbose family transporter subunit IID n=1 Tax=Eiseniibacteriota bacterium TaxID=2212470 RepID=A0A9D6LB04_UNCEI|nr:PTS system mannose/fructose/sorbose family transporter subunit IID [Candidatus Eisenbacteria bacterium]MBI3539339.1 PTS system mannose/fructose/sorbose family transporter subunit IID [Candidatus Eisenbacteria bacterium]
MARLTGGDLWRVAWRTPFLQATWNYERQQGLGWAFCIAPVIERLYPDREERCRRLAEHTAYFNTQPTLASVALGAVARLEEERVATAAAPPAPDDAIARVQAVLGSALAAVGDQLFWFTLRPFVACLGVLLALGGSWIGAVALWLTYNLVHMTLRLRGVGWGYAEGPAVLGSGLRGRLEGLSRLIAQLGAALVGVVVAALLVPGGDPQTVTFQATLAAGLTVGLVTAQRPRPSPTQWAIGAGALCIAAVWFR